MERKVLLMKKTVKLICIVLAVIMTVLPLTGCSEAELGLLDMMGKLVCNGGSVDIKEEFVIDLSDIVSAGVYASVFDDELAPENYPDKLTVTMTGKQDIDNMAIDSIIEIKLGELFKLSFKYIVVDQTMYWGDFAFEYDEEALSPALFDKTANEDNFLFLSMLEKLDGVDYFTFNPVEMLESLYSSYDMYETEAGTNEELAEIDALIGLYDQLMQLIYDNMSEVYPISIDFIKNAFSGYTTGAVTKIENGYKISADVEDIVNMLFNYVEYFFENLDVVIESYVRYYEELAEIAGENGMEELEELMVLLGDEMRASIDQIPAEAEEFSLDEIVDTESVEEFCRMLEGTEAELEYTEVDGVLTQIMNMNIVVEDIIVAKVEMLSEAKPCDDFEVVVPSDATTMTLFESVAYLASASQIAEYSYIEEMSITWNGTEGTAQVYGTLLGDESGDKYALGLYDFHNIDGSMYLPMRRICERFGEVVDWDAVNGKAYVVRGEEKIDMTGVIIGDKTFIKIRDFEKLGYLVDYQVDENGAPWALINVNIDMMF